jgi:hypothetical protein
LFIINNIPLKPPKYDITSQKNNSPKYNRFNVDNLPVIKMFKELDYKQLQVGYKAIPGKDKSTLNHVGKILYLLILYVLIVSST